MANENRRLFGMLGFAMRAGKLVIGTEQVCLAMSKRGKGALKLVVICKNASDATKKKLLTKSEFYGIEAIEINLDSDELGAIIGKTYAPATVGVADEGFAKEIAKASEEQ